MVGGGRDIIFKDTGTQEELLVIYSTDSAKKG